MNAKIGINNFINALDQHPRAMYFVAWSVAFAFWYTIHPLSPDFDLEQNIGWWAWWDQSNYLKIIHEILKLSPETDSFWPGFSILGAFFEPLFPSNPFLLFTFVVGWLVGECIREIVSKETTNIEGLVVSIALTCAHYKFAYQSIIIPWNTLFIYGFTAVFVRTIFCGERGKSFVWLLIIFANLAFFSRPQDGVIALLFCGIFLFSKVPAEQKSIFLYAFVGLWVALSAITALYLAILWQGELSEYLKTNINHGFSISEIPRRFYTIFFNGSFFFSGEHKELTLLGFSPSIFLYNPFACVGLFFLFLQSLKSLRDFEIFCYLCAPLLLYLSFNPSGNAVHFWTYTLFHYVWIYITFLAVYGYFAFRLIYVQRREAIASLTSISLVIVCLIFTFTSHEKFQPLAFSQNYLSTGIYISEPSVKKIRIHSATTNTDDLSRPGEERRFEISVNGEPLEPWSDYYLNSGSGFYSIYLLDEVKNGDFLAVNQKQQPTRWLGIFSVKWTVRGLLKK